jgi:CHAD domain-containing protein
MPDYAFSADETLADGVRRLYVAMLDDAVAQLSGNGDPDPIEAVHEARKSLKKARALVRLVRDDFPQYRKANRLCRNAGRKISELRDASARIETLDMARTRFPVGVVDGALDRIRAELVARRDHAHEQAERPVAQALAIAKRARALADTFDLSRVDVHTLHPGLARTYGRGLLVFRKVLRGYDTELLHAWRKRAKYHRYHVGFLINAWPVPMRAREKALRMLTEYLGDDHDLAVLRETLHTVVDEQPALQVDAAAVVEVAQGVRAELQRAAMDEGARCFAEDGDLLAARLTSYVSAWYA